ncbi:MAG: CRISPR-associated endonuclease Cas2 [Gammaproteobacteria bacterium]|nr:CRISPR-associated endonuclease Cas2 [Gammaproteobacteria bacterium]
MKNQKRRRDWPWGWKTMWVFTLFDLPTYSKATRKKYAEFRKCLLKDGFTMMQYSVYVRHCNSLENANLHIKRMSSLVPAEGEVRFFVITDRQYEKILTFEGRKIVRDDTPRPSQLQLF